MEQKTAVEFLLRELRIEDLAKGEQLSVVLQICEQAKQMEKEQIVEANISGMQFVHCDENRWEEYAEKYYNETFGSQGSPDK